jgi:tRNA(Ile)-lysidine synthase
MSSATSKDSSVLLGHTRNDQAETVMLNLIRGAGTRGIAGIPYRREPNFFRPLLDVSRSETRELAALAGLPFLDDPSNSDMTIRRNRVRSDILPRMEELNPNLVDALARAAGHSADDEALLDSFADAVPISGDSDGAWVPASAVLVLPTAIQARVLRRLVGTVRSTDGVTSAELARIRQVLDGSREATQLESGLRVTKVGPMLRLAAG